MEVITDEIYLELLKDPIFQDYYDKHLLRAAIKRYETKISAAAAANAPAAADTAAAANAPAAAAANAPADTAAANAPAAAANAAAADDEAPGSPTRYEDIPTQNELNLFFQPWTTQGEGFKKCLELPNNNKKRIAFLLENIATKYNIMVMSKVDLLSEELHKLKILDDSGTLKFTSEATPNFKNKGYIYVWLDSGIYVADDALSSGLNTKITRHTSLAFEKQVLCAGEISFRDNKIISISNASGHYRPHPQHLANLRNYLQRCVSNNSAIGALGIDEIQYNVVSTHQRNDPITDLDASLISSSPEEISNISLDLDTYSNLEYFEIQRSQHQKRRATSNNLNVNFGDFDLFDDGDEQTTETSLFPDESWTTQIRKRSKHTDMRKATSDPNNSKGPGR